MSSPGESDRYEYFKGILLQYALKIEVKPDRDGLFVFLSTFIHTGYLQIFKTMSVRYFIIPSKQQVSVDIDSQVNPDMNSLKLSLN